VESTHWEQLQSLFHRAVELPEIERERFLKCACDGESALEAELLAMLQSDGRGTIPSLLEQGLPGIAGQFVGLPEEAVLVREIGPYRLLRVLGEGGMGVVWLAKRQDTDALVAIKFLPNANLSPARRERFAREIKTLAKLRHPYIARLYDAGTLADSTPWFVMEYVEGERLTDYVRERSHTADEILQLFRKVCEAVRYAHSQEIIHRDLKPSNIMVEKDGAPRLLDFGIARELQGLDDPSERTRPGLRFVSPDYAAPEWVREGTVGFFTDVYSLGVVLYESLTGKLPFDRAKRTIEEDGRQIDLNPQKPSALGARLGLSKSAWSDLDVLCLKSLRADPQERYLSVEALLRDLDHYLQNEPLEAQPDSLRYRIGKVFARHRRPVLATGLALALVVGLIVFFTLRLAAARDVALAEAARTQRIQKFMTSLFQGDDSEAGPSEDLRVVTLLDRGVQKAQRLQGESAIQAELYRTLGSIYDQLGKYDQAETLFESALKLDRGSSPQNDMAEADDLVALGLLRSDQGKSQEAESLVRQGTSIVEQHRPIDAMRQANATSALGRVLIESGQYPAATEVLDHAVALQTKLDPSSVELSDTLTLLANAQLYLGNYDESERLNQRALDMDRKIYGESHPNVAADLINLGQLEDQWGHYVEAEHYDREAVAITKAWYGTDHPDAARQSAILAQVLVHEGKYDEAEPLLRSAFGTERKFFSPTDAHLAYILNALGSVEVNRGEFAAAMDNFRQVISLYRTAYGDGDYRVGIGMSNLGNVYLQTKQYTEAEHLFRQAIDLWKKVLPADNINIAIGQVRLGRAIFAQHRYPEAVSHTLAGYEILEKQSTPSASSIQAARKDLAAGYLAMKQPEKARIYEGGVASVDPKK
jgi:serine/threonine protein kinase/Tfp pilus assembly protein PilF